MAVPWPQLAVIASSASHFPFKDSGSPWGSGDCASYTELQAGAMTLGPRLLLLPLSFLTSHGKYEVRKLEVGITILSSFC